MPKPRLIIGVDPGPIPGIAGLWSHSADKDKRSWSDVEFAFAQCDHETLMDVIDSWYDSVPTESILIATETYVISNRSGRSSTSDARDATLYVVNKVTAYADDQGIARVTRPAGIVKKFATNDRLMAARLLGATTGCTHARDASRHMVYAAVEDGGFPDPFSKKEW